MLKHEAKLIDPDAEQIVAALTEATAAANKRCRARLLVDDPAKWRKFAREAAAKPEGHAMFRGGRGGVPATQVLAAWWTDAAGRKHVVLRGRRVEHAEARRLLDKVELNTRPPLWHAYPEYVCRRTVGTLAQIVCACGCGAVGTPAALGWMGETCGPCFDRKEEHGADALGANLPGALYGDREPLRAVACSPDGNRVAAVEGSTCVTYWDIPARTRTVMNFTNGGMPSDVAFSADGQHLIVAGMVLFVAFDLTADPPARIAPAFEVNAAALRAVALPDPTLAVLLNWFPDRCRADVVRVPSGETIRATYLTAPDFGRNTAPVHQLAVSYDGTHFAVVGDVVALFHREAATPLWERPERYFTLAFAHDGRRVIVATTGRLIALDATSGRSLVECRMKGAAAREAVTALAVDPDGQWVYSGMSQGAVCVFAADTLELRAVFEWHLGWVTRLAVSADGTRLFSSGSDGCVKVWPIRDLLRGV